MDDRTGSIVQLLNKINKELAARGVKVVVVNGLAESLPLFVHMGPSTTADEIADAVALIVNTQQPAADIPDRGRRVPGAQYVPA